MADGAPKDKKKQKCEVKKSDRPGTKKPLPADPISLAAKENVGEWKHSNIPEIPPGLKSVAKAEVESLEETPKPILTPNASDEVELQPTLTPSLKPVEVNEYKTSKLKSTLKPVTTTDVNAEDPLPQPTDRPAATVELNEKEPPQVKPAAIAEDADNKVTPKPVVSVERDVHDTSLSHKGSYMAPKAATKRDVKMLYDLDNEKLAELREAFHLFDLNNDGFIDKEDLKKTYISLGKTDVCDEQIHRMLSEATNPLDFDAFVILLGYKSVDLDPEEVLLEALSQWDYDNSGLISEERIKHDLMMWGDRFSSDEVEMALEDAPVFYQRDTGTSMIDYVKFCKILYGLHK